MLGITSLIMANSLLTQMDFFIYYQGDYNPEFLYGFFSLFVHIIFQVYIILYGQRLGSYKMMLLGSSIMNFILMCIIPVVVVFVPAFTGFLIAIFFMILIGLMGAIMQSAIYGIVSILPSKYIIAMSVGQGFSGITLNIVKFIILLTFESTEGKSPEERQSIYFSEIYLFYSIATIFVVVTNFLVLVIEHIN